MYRACYLLLLAGFFLLSACSTTTPSTSAGLRRVVTGIDEQGRSVVLSDSRLSGAQASYSAAQLLPIWQTGGPDCVVPFRDAGACGTPKPSLNLAPGDTIYALIRLAPSTGPDQADSAPDVPGLAEALQRGDKSRHPTMHATTTIDYGFVLEGEVTMLLDTADVILKAGDVIIQGGANHTWINRTRQPATILGVIVGASARSEHAFQEKCLAVAGKHHPNIDARASCACVAARADQDLKAEMIAARDEHDLTAASRAVILGCGFHDK